MTSSFLTNIQLAPSQFFWDVDPPLFLLLLQIQCFASSAYFPEGDEGSYPFPKVLLVTDMVINSDSKVVSSTLAFPFVAVVLFHFFPHCHLFSTIFGELHWEEVLMFVFLEEM